MTASRPRTLRLTDQVSTLLDVQIARVDAAREERLRALDAWRADLHGDASGDLELAHVRARVRHGIELESLAAIVRVIWRDDPAHLPAAVTPLADTLDQHEPQTEDP